MLYTPTSSTQQPKIHALSIPKGVDGSVGWDWVGGMGWKEQHRNYGLEFGMEIRYPLLHRLDRKIPLAIVPIPLYPYLCYIYIPASTIYITTNHFSYVNPSRSSGGQHIDWKGQHRRSCMV